MSEQEEQYIHFLTCIQNLNEARRILKIIKQQPKNPLIGPAFEFALIEYSKPYTMSRGNFKYKHVIRIENVPPEYRDLHKEILKARHQIHAHSDLTIEDAFIYVLEDTDGKHVGISKNIVYRTDNLRRIDDIIDLIEKTLDLMYIREKQLKANLFPSLPTATNAAC